MAAKKFDPKKDLRERVSASEKVARRDAGVWYPDSGGVKRVKINAGEYVPLLRNVTGVVKEVKRTGKQGDFDLQGALKNTFKGKNYGGADWWNRSISVKAGTVAGPKTARNNTDLAKAQEKNAVRDRAIKKTQRKGGY